MNVLILGVDGYIGWPVACELMARGHTVMGIDSGARREHYGLIDVNDGYGDGTPLPIASIAQRKRMLNSYQRIWQVDVREKGIIEHALHAFSPDAVLHLAEQPSRTFAMCAAEGAILTLNNNLVSLIRLLEAVRENKWATRVVRVSSVNQRGLVADYCTLTMQTASDMLRIACETWGLRATEIEVGLVYGLGAPATEDKDNTRFDYCPYFGNVVHRFCAQTMAGEAMTVYGDGRQIVPLVALADVVDVVCSALEQPAYAKGVYERLCCRFESFTVADIAAVVAKAAEKKGWQASTATIPNPRGAERRPALAFGVDLIAPARPTTFNERQAINIWQELEPVASLLRRQKLRDRASWGRRLA